METGPGHKKQVTESQLLIKKCHHCGHVMELGRETDKCHHCQKAFLPSNYFSKIHDKTAKYKDLFSQSSELHEDEIIKGLHALW